MPFCKCYPKRNLRGIGRAAKPFFGGCPISLRFEMTINTNHGGFENLNHRSIYFFRQTPKNGGESWNPGKPVRQRGFTTVAALN